MSKPTPMADRRFQVADFPAARPGHPKRRRGKGRHSIAAPRSVVLAFALSALAGCSLLRPQPDPARFFTLEPRPGVEAAVPASSPSGPLYGLGPITLPGYLDRNEIALRRSATEIAYSPVDRWAEPLSRATARALFVDLSAALHTDRILLFPWPGGTRIDYQIEVELLQFEATSEGESQLAARWTVRDRAGNYVTLRESSFSHPAPNGTVDAVAALGATLNDLADEIARAIQALPAASDGEQGTGKRERKR